MKLSFVIIVSLFLSCSMAGKFVNQPAHKYNPIVVQKDSIYVFHVDTVYQNETNNPVQEPKKHEPKKTTPKTKPVRKSSVKKTSVKESTIVTKAPDKIHHEIPKDTTILPEVSELPIQENNANENFQENGNQENYQESNELIKPDSLLIWMVIYNKEIFTHRVKKFNYPGTLKVNSTFLRDMKRIVILESTFNSTKWQLVLPQKDGEYYVTAKLLRDQN